MSIQYRIAWKSLINDFTGRGDFCLTKQEADAWIIDLNSKFPDLQHWIEDNSEGVYGSLGT